MVKWEGKVITSKEVAKLYSDKPDEWLLLEVIKMGKNNRAESFRLLAYSKDKDELHEYLMDDESWSSKKKYIFVFADPEKLCDI